MGRKPGVYPPHARAPNTWRPKASKALVALASVSHRQGLPGPVSILYSGGSGGKKVRAAATTLALHPDLQYSDSKYDTTPPILYRLPWHPWLRICTMLKFPKFVLGLFEWVRRARARGSALLKVMTMPHYNNHHSVVQRSNTHVTVGSLRSGCV